MMASCATNEVVGHRNKRWYDNNSKIEIVNDQTVIFRNVVKIEVKTCNECNTQLTYVYDLKHSKLVRVARGAFEVNVPIGDYLIQSNKKITKANYDVLIE